MADIKQAAQWLWDGKKVCRSGWGNQYLFYDAETTGRIKWWDSLGAGRSEVKEFSPMLLELSADDWEIFTDLS